MYVLSGSTVEVDHAALDENTTMVQVQYYCGDNVLDYIFHIINSANTPVNEAYVDVKRIINGSYFTVTSGLTDGNGDVTFHLLPYEHYRIFINKTGYNDATSDYMPSESVRTKTFMIYTPDPEFDNATTYLNSIYFNATLNDNGSIYVTYHDMVNGTEYAQICVYVNSTMLLIDCYDTSDDDMFDYYFTGINVTYGYVVVLITEHALFGEHTDLRYLSDRSTLTNDTEFNDLWDDIFGDNPFGWSSFIGFLVLCAGVFSFGRRNCGVALVVTGGVMMFLEFIVGLTLMGSVLGVLFIVVGILIQWGNQRKEVGGF
jgi:hypothetical protein